MKTDPLVPLKLERDLISSNMKLPGAYTVDFQLSSSLGKNNQFIHIPA